MSKKITRKGSGRTKGSFSFVKVPLAELCAKFADPNTPVVIGRKWAEAVGFTGLTSAAAVDITESIQGSTPQTMIAAKVIDLDAEPENTGPAKENESTSTTTTLVPTI